MDERTWLAEGTDMLSSLPIGVVNQALRGSEGSYTVNPDKPEVCFHVNGVDVIVTRLQFSVAGVDFVRITLYKPDGKTPIIGEVRRPTQPTLVHALAYCTAEGIVVSVRLYLAVF